MIPEITGDFLQQLRSFYYVATCGSVSDAACQMNRTQSAVTYQIQLLEKSLNLILFERLKNKMILTDEGKTLLTWVLRVFDTITEMHEDIHSDEQYGSIHIIGTRPIFGSEYFSRSFSIFHKRYPNIHVSLNSGHPSFLYSSIKNGQNDFGIIGMANILEGLDFIPLFQSPFLLAVGKSQADQFSSPMTPEKLKTLPYISFSVDYREKISKFSILPHEIHEFMGNKSILSCSNYYIIMHYVALGIGCTLIDVLSLKSLNIMDKIHIIDISSIVPNLQYGIILRKKNNISKFKKHFIDIIINNMKDMDLTSEIKNFV